jgi:hypothetical protein
MVLMQGWVGSGWPASAAVYGPIYGPAQHGMSFDAGAWTGAADR